MILYKALSRIPYVYFIGAEATELSPIRGKNPTLRGNDRSPIQAREVQCFTSRQRGTAGESGGHGSRATGRKSKNAGIATTECTAGVRQRQIVSTDCFD